MLNFPLLDVPNAVAGQSGEQSGPGIDAADVPEAAHQEAASGGLDHLLKARRGSGTFQNSVHRSRGWLLALLIGPIPRVFEIFQNTVAHEVNFLRRNPVLRRR